MVSGNKNPNKVRFGPAVIVSLIVCVFIFSFFFQGCCLNIPISQAGSGNTSTAASTATDNTAGTTQQETSENTAAISEETIPSKIVMETSPQEIRVEGYANNYSFYDIYGREIIFSDFSGKIIVLNFWATWCDPCAQEIPEFAKVFTEYMDKNIQFFGISDDNIESLKTISRVSSINYPTLVDGSINTKLYSEFSIDAIPHTYIFNGKGEPVFDMLGQMSYEELVSSINDVLE